MANLHPKRQNENKIDAIYSFQLSKIEKIILNLKYTFVKLVFNKQSNPHNNL